MSDVAGHSGTTAAIAVNQTVFGRIDGPFDEDWFRLDLSAGQSVTITLRGAAENGLLDPILDLYDASGTLIDLNLDISADNRNARLQLTASEAGTYFIDAYAAGAISGEYVLTVSSLTGSPVEALLWGTQVPTNAIDICFAPRGVTVDGVMSEGWSDGDIVQAMAALDAIEAVTTLTFTRVDTVEDADFVLGRDDDELSVANLLGYFHPPEEPEAGKGNLSGVRWDRDALAPGTITQAVFTHEILHGLGLAHPHDTGGTSLVMTGVLSAFGDYGFAGLNQGVYTTMSYNFGWNDGDWGTFGSLAGSWGYQSGPMALDIAALQAVYGANPETGGGDDVYLLPEANLAGTSWRAIWDTGGTDTLRYDGLRDALIDLRAATLAYGEGGGGYLSSARAVAGGFTIAHGVVIENATTGTGNDRIIGNDADNVLWSGRGNDRLVGAGGDDRITAHRGHDTVEGGTGNDWVSAGRGDDTVFGGAGNDVILAGQGDDKVMGGPGDDLILGRKGRDVIDGGAGNDVIQSGPGDDRVRGGAGDDLVTLGFGADTFVFMAGDGRDTITDFNPSRDRLLVETWPVQIHTDPAGLRLMFDDGGTILLAGLTGSDDITDALTLLT
ncbi:MAG: M10 family metallopeptidase C-terminal domain-containing protein [Pseudomonadota bacterium]|nr:M10 family metallopeptidase C-terminal domain-containing protein [Pseudomonadota bacterium]